MCFTKLKRSNCVLFQSPWALVFCRWRSGRWRGSCAWLTLLVGQVSGKSISLHAFCPVGQPLTSWGCCFLPDLLLWCLYQNNLISRRSWTIEGREKEVNGRQNGWKAFKSPNRYILCLSSICIHTCNMCCLENVKEYVAF